MTEFMDNGNSTPESSLNLKVFGKEFYGETLICAAIGIGAFALAGVDNYRGEQSMPLPAELILGAAYLVGAVVCEFKQRNPVINPED